MIDLTMVVIGAGGALALLVLAAIFFATVRKICGPNEALVVSGFGKSQVIAGRKRGFEIYIGGGVYAYPFVQKVERVSLEVMEVPITIRNAYSKGGIAMDIDAIANVKIASDSELITNAIERFLGRDINEIRRAAKETLEGHLRQVIAGLTPEQVNEDRLAFAESLADESEMDLQKLGLHLDTLKIQHVKDEVGYLDATGRKAIALIIRAAEIAESDANRDAEQTEAEENGRANVIQSNASAKIAQLSNDLRRVKADLDSEVNSEEERTAAAAREARARAEQKLQQVRSELEGIRQEVETVLPSEASRKAEEYRARGDAAIIRERGRAVSEALSQLHNAWNQAGPNALQIQLIEDLEKILAAATKGVHKVHIDGLSVIDSGDGQTLPNYLSAYPAMLSSMFDAIETTTGIDIPGEIAGSRNGKAHDTQEVAR